MSLKRDADYAERESVRFGAGDTGAGAVSGGHVPVHYDGTMNVRARTACVTHLCVICFSLPSCTTSSMIDDLARSPVRR